MQKEAVMEKVYTAMKQAGVMNIVFGILLSVMGLLTTVGSAFLIFHGARLLKRKREIIF